MSKQSEGKTSKDNKLRYDEYYGMTNVFDGLYQRATQGQKFKRLMSIITTDDNILLAYRSIKRNTGSKTSACDKITIKQIEKMSKERFLYEIKQRFQSYQPQKVRRKEIPKPNGKTRPLGIPSIWDRLIQQCILQVIEPICEAQFSERSYGFRPNRSAEHALVECATQINIAQRTYVIDVDIQGFFDEVNHTKLMRQLWTLGIQDKQLLVIIRKILKAPIQMQNGKVKYPTKGTPQGGILSPLLANVNLNEFDKWIESQWTEFPTKHEYTQRKIKLTHLKKTRLKPMYIVRYADDLKIFTDTRSNAQKILHAVQMYLKERLKLSISQEKSQITNLKKRESEFLGFTLKATKKGKRKDKTKYVIESHMSKKAVKRTKQELKEQIKKIQKSPNSLNAIRRINRYNSMVIGKHNYYKTATHISQDLRKIAIELEHIMYNRFPKAKIRSRENPQGFTSKGKYEGKDKGILPYMKSKQVRYLMQRPILPISFVKFKNPKSKAKTINKYIPEGRKAIHKKLSDVTEVELKWLRDNPFQNERATIELNDNRISLYVAQRGKCAVTGQPLFGNEWHTHHKELWSKTHDDSYRNLVLILSDVHVLVHAAKQKTINKYLKKLRLNEEQISKINELRKLVGNEEICIVKQKILVKVIEQLTLFQSDSLLVGELTT